MQILNSFIPLKLYRNTQTRNIFNTQNNNTLPAFKGTKLAPLQKDIVCFKANEKKPEIPEENTFSGTPVTDAERARLARELGKIIKNESQCQFVSRNATVSEKNLKHILDYRLSEFIFDKKKNPDGPIMPIQTRVKTPESIKEKTMDALADLILNNKEQFNVYEPEDIKKTIGDIVGARVTLRKSDKSETSKIIQRLIEAVEAGELKITKIENYVPKEIDEDLKYFNEEDLEELAKAVNKRRKPNERAISVSNKSKSTGYMALHIDIDLSNRNYVEKNNDYKGEIQIVGYDVEKLKDVEDYCYKVKQGKDIKAGDRAYAAFVQYFNRYFDDTNYNENIKDDFTEYTRRAYLFQRKREPIHIANDKKQEANYKLPTITDCNMEGLIPPQLDFNMLSRIKKNSDDLYRTINDANRLTTYSV